MNIDPWIFSFSAVTVVVTIWMGFWAAKKSKTASDFFVAGRSVSVGWNASAISGEYLSAASFMGVAGMVMSSGYDALWYPVCYACGYLFLLLFIAGPLRRFGAYTIPDFAEGRFDSPVFRKIAVVFVLFIGFFYTMPQMKGAGTTLAYIFPGLPYWAGVVLVGAVITLNVALGGMKGITLVQAFQYWMKMFAISVPIFVLMAVYGHYGKQLEANGNVQPPTSNLQPSTNTGNAPLNVERLSLPEKSKPANGSIAVSTSMTLPVVDGWVTIEPPGSIARVEQRLKELTGSGQSWRNVSDAKLVSVLMELSEYEGRRVVAHTNLNLVRMLGNMTVNQTNRVGAAAQVRAFLAGKEVCLLETRAGELLAVQKSQEAGYLAALAAERGSGTLRKPLPEKAPKDEPWLSPFGPLTTKAAKAAKPELAYNGELKTADLTVGGDGAAGLMGFIVGKFEQGQISPIDQAVPTSALVMLQLHALLTVKTSPFNFDRAVQVRYSPLLGDTQILWKRTERMSERELAKNLLRVMETNGITVLRESGNRFVAFPTKDAVAKPVDTKPYALLYTYSLIIALVCGTAGLPHILVRFYTNPDGVAAKRTTMWVMILIGVFYVFPPVFGVLGRNFMPELYEGIGAKGTDKIVLELPRLLNEKVPGLGSILSGITCAGAFAAFMSTFSGLLVSMTGALAHDVYGRILKPKATAEQRMRMFKIGAVLLGAVAILLGMQVEKLQINFMVGQAFAIAAASYFPLLFMAVWWRNLTMQGAAVGMLSGGCLAVIAITLTSLTDLGMLPLTGFWAGQPLLRILCEQPAIWAVPLAIGLMVIVSKLTPATVPSDIRMKMLVLHAPEKLGLKQEYIQEHQHGH